MKYDYGYCMYCDGRFVGRGDTDEAAYQHLNQQLMEHEDICLMRYSADKKNKKRK